jgi:hypothetical protein
VPLRLALVAVAVVVASCTPRTSGTTDAGPNGACKVDHDCGAGQLCDTNDNTCKDCNIVLKLPPPNNACLPKCGNELGVGMPCTLNGKQCNHNDIHALFCTIDQDSTADLIMCTGPCSQDSDCGSGAFCEGDPSNPGGPKGCVPTSCAGEGEGEGAAGEGEGEGGQ